MLDSQEKRHCNATRPWNLPAYNGIFMYQNVDRSQTQFYPDDRYHPRYTQPVTVRPDGASVVIGVMKDDGPPEDDSVRLPDVPFEIIVPANMPYYAVNLEVWRRLKNGESRIGLDFTPSPQISSTIPILTTWRPRY